MMNIWSLLFLICALFQVIQSISSYNPKSSLQIYLAGNFTDQSKYALIITDKSTKNGNIFQFNDTTTENPLILTSELFNMIKTNITYTFSTTYTINGVDQFFAPIDILNSTTTDCGAYSMYADCTSSTAPGSCALLKALDPVATNTKPSQVDCTTLGNSQMCPTIVNTLNDTTSFTAQADYTQFLSDCSNGSPYTSFNVQVQVYIGNYTLAYAPVMQKNNLTFYYLPLTSTSNNDFLVTATEARLWTLPAMSQTISIDSASSLNSLPNTNTPYKTIYKQQLVQTNYASVMYCRYTLTYTGFVRGVYINGYPGEIHSPNTTGLDIVSSVTSSIRLPLNPKSLNVITVLGYRINQTQMQFSDCRTTWNGVTVISSPQFTYYTFQDGAYTPEDKQPTQLYSQCSSTCLRCNKDNCLKCNSDYVLYQGSCHEQCSSPASYENAIRACTMTPNNVGVLLQSPTISGSLVTVKGYMDVPDDTPYVMIIHPSHTMLYKSIPYVAINGTLSLAESSPILMTGARTNGSYELTTYLKSIGTSGSSNSRITQVFYYRLYSKVGYTLPAFSWTSAPDTLSSTALMAPTVIDSETFPTYYYLDPSLYYIFYTYLQCYEPCQVKITSNGTVQLIRNDRTLLANLTFNSKWEYTYSTFPAGFYHLQFKVNNAIYFETSITGNNFTNYEGSPPYFGHKISSLTYFSPTCSISNCINCNGTTCLSCKTGYYLLADKSACVSSCSSYSQKNNPVENTCLASCTGAYRDINSTNCIPTCKQSGYIYSESKGCALCVEECETCATVNTCSVCKPSAIFSSASFCQRKTGDVFSSYNFNVSQTIQFFADFSTSNNYVSIVTDSSLFQDLIFYFYNDPRPVPRVLRAVRYQATNSSSGAATLPTLSIAETGNIYIHYLKIVKDTKNPPSNVTITGFRQEALLDWARYENFPVVDSHSNGYLSYEGVNGLPLRTEYYESVVVSRLYEHNYGAKIFCSAHIIFKGNMQKLYLNSELLIFDSAIRYGSNLKEVYTRKISLRGSEMSLVTVVGSQFGWNIFEFTNCTDENGNSVSPTFSGYNIVGQEASPSVFAVTNNTYCSSNCKSCKNLTACVQCQEGYYLVNGACLNTCQSPYSKRSLFGFCDSTVRNQGYISDYSYDIGTDSVDISFFLPLPTDTKIIVAIHPWNLTYANYPKHEPTSSYSSLAEASFGILDYEALEPEFDVTMPTANAAYQVMADSTVFNYITIDVHILKQNSIIIATWLTPPTTLNQRLEADLSEYVDISNKTFDMLQSSREYMISFYLDCSSSCKLTLNMSGNVEIYINDKTFIMKTYFDPEFGAFSVQGAFSGLNYFTIKIDNSTRFAYNFTGTFNIYAPYEFVMSDVRQITTISACTAANCVNCYQNECLSCQDGTFMTASGLCSASCSSSYNALTSQRVCLTKTCESMGMVTKSGVCIPLCATVGLYYTSGSGCSSSNLCHASCEHCSGPAVNECLTCILPRSFVSSSYTCACPSGTTDLASGGCAYSSWISVGNDQVETVVESCQNLKFSAVITDALVSSSVSISWEVVNPTIDQAGLVTYLSTQTSKDLTIPLGYLQRNSYYNLTFYYMNAVYERTQNWTVFQTVRDFMFNASVKNGPTLNFNSFSSNSVELLLKDTSSCFSSSNTSIQTQWTQISGDFTLDLNSFYDSNNPLVLSFPSCSISPPLGNFDLQAVITLGGMSQFSKTLTVDLTFLAGTFNSSIVSSTVFEGLQLSTKNLLLEAQHILITDCPVKSGEPVQYQWTCLKATSQSDYNAGNLNSCSDPSGLFGTQTTTGQLTIPESYYSPNEFLSLTATITRHGVSKSSNILIGIVDKYDLSVSILCTGDCANYIEIEQYDFTAQIAGVLSGSLSYYWQINPSNLPSITSNNVLRIYAQNLATAITVSNHLEITLVVQNTSHYGFATFSMPVVKPPTGGNLTITPAIGYSLHTKFNIQTSDWISPLTLEYLFYYRFADEDTWNALISDYQLSPSITAYLAAKGQDSSLIIQAIAKDPLGGMSSVQKNITVQVYVHSLIDFISEAENLIADSQGESSFDRLLLLSMISQEFVYWENVTSASISTTACPSCSGNGYCESKSTRCTCKTGWSTSDCSMTSSAFDEITDFKVDVLQALQTNFTTADISAQADSVYTLLKNFAAYENFDSNKSLTEIQNVLEKTLNVLDNDTILTLDESVALAEMVNSMMQFSSTYDCGAKTDFTKKLADKVYSYLQKISQSTLYNKLPAENATVIITSIFDIYTDRVTLCDLQNKVITTSGNAATTTLNLDSSLTGDCNVFYDLQYYVFNGDFLKCNVSGSDSTKDTVAIQITNTQNGTVTNITTNVTIDLTNTTRGSGKDLFCPAECPMNKHRQCVCTNDLSLFDVKGQIQKIFGQSSISLLLEYNNTLTFKFWQTISFWSVFVLTFWLAGTVLVVKFKIPNLNMFEVFKKKRVKTNKERLKLMLCITHPILMIYYLENAHISKSGRAIVYYARNLLLLTFSSIFSNKSSESIDTFSDMFDFNMYLIILPLFTTIPITQIMTSLIKFSHPKVKVQTRWPAIKRYSGRIFTTVIIIVCLLIITIISANQLPVQRLNWALDFFKSLLQDIFLNPIISLVTQYYFHKFLESESLKKRPKLQKRMLKYLDTNLLDIMKTQVVSNSNVITPYTSKTTTKSKTLIPSSLTLNVNKVRNQTLQSLDIDEPNLSPAKNLFTKGSIHHLLMKSKLTSIQDNQLEAHLEGPKHVFFNESDAESQCESEKKPDSQEEGTPKSKMDPEYRKRALNKFSQKSSIFSKTTTHLEAKDPEDIKAFSIEIPQTMKISELGKNSSEEAGITMDFGDLSSHSQLIKNSNMFSPTTSAKSPTTFFNQIEQSEKDFDGSSRTNDGLPSLMLPGKQLSDGSMLFDFDAELSSIGGGGETPSKIMRQNWNPKQRFREKMLNKEEAADRPSSMSENRKRVVPTNLRQSLRNLKMRGSIGGDLNAVQEGEETESPLQQINPFKSKKKSAGKGKKVISVKSIKEVNDLEVENQY